MSGRLFVVLGPSGAGKDTLIAGAAAARPDLVWARRVITRPEAAGGEPFESATRGAFERRRRAGEFAVWWEAHGLLYGVPITIRAALDEGRDVVFNGSRGALGQARLVFPRLQAILVTAPKRVLAARLAARGREDSASIEARMARAAWPAPKGARVVRNGGSVETGVAALLEALSRSAERVG